MDLFCPDYTPFPCDPLQVALYATWLARIFKYSSITNYLSGLCFFLRQNGFAGIDYSGFILSLTLKGIKRKLGNTPTQAIPLLPSRLFWNLTENHGHNAWRAAILCSFKGLFKEKSNNAFGSCLDKTGFSVFPLGDGNYC